MEKRPSQSPFAVFCRAVVAGFMTTIFTTWIVSFCLALLLAPSVFVLWLLGVI